MKGGTAPSQVLECEDSVEGCLDKKAMTAKTYTTYNRTPYHCKHVSIFIVYNYTYC